MGVVLAVLGFGMTPVGLSSWMRRSVRSSSAAIGCVFVGTRSSGNKIKQLIDFST